MFYIVATPIGNLEDITIRAVETLKKAHFILAEDTRESAKLLNRYGITSTVVSYRDQNHIKMLPKIIEKLDSGLDIALICDAGTPTLSDPGYKLVQELRIRGYQITSLPGAFAGAVALSMSGLPTDKFAFLGFLPKSDISREEILRKYLELDCSIVLYESPKRVRELIKQIKVVVNDQNRLLSVANDLTKMHEFVVTASIKEIESKLPEVLKGEFVIMISKIMPQSSL